MKFGIRNKGVLPVTMRNAKVKLIVNGVDMGTLDSEEDWYIVNPGVGVNFMELLL